MTRTFALAALLLTCCSPSGGPPDLHLSDAWARETVAGQGATAAYLTIGNSGGGSDRLVEASVPAPARASLHTTSYSNGIARMRPLDTGLEIAPGETVRLEPGGPHIMVESLSEPASAGDSLQVTLRFERSGERTLEVPVRNAAAPGPHQSH